MDWLWDWVVDWRHLLWQFSCQESLIFSGSYQSRETKAPSLGPSGMSLGHAVIKCVRPEALQTSWHSNPTMLQLLRMQHDVTTGNTSLPLPPPPPSTHSPYPPRNRDRWEARGSEARFTGNGASTELIATTDRLLHYSTVEHRTAVLVCH